MSILKKILRAAVAQPWDYIGEGAPNGWEFRIEDPDRDDSPVALYNPREGQWRIFQQVVLLAKVSPAEMDRHTQHWAQFLEVLDEE